MKDLAVNEFKSLKENDLYSLAKLEWWLMKYEDYYKDLKSYWYCDICNYDEDFNSCFCENPSSENLFLVLFQELEEFCDYRKYENYFKVELETYYKVKDNPKALKELVIKNEEIAVTEFSLFFLNYYDYQFEPVHLNIYSKALQDFDIYVDFKDFDNTITFLDIFDKLFWKDNIYPESEILLRIAKAMNENEKNI